MTDLGKDSSQDYYWTPEWQEGEREADEDIQLGRLHTANTWEGAVEWLRGIGMTDDKGE